MKLNQKEKQVFDSWSDAFVRFSRVVRSLKARSSEGPLSNEEHAALIGEMVKFNAASGALLGTYDVEKVASLLSDDVPSLREVLGFVEKALMTEPDAAGDK